MNISKFVVLGALDYLEVGSGYDIIRELDKKMISKWTDVKKGSIYHALKSLLKKEEIIEVEKTKKGLYPTMTLYSITDSGRVLFDKMQDEAFLGLFPVFYGFKLALKFNMRKTPSEINHTIDKSLAVIDNIIYNLDKYIKVNKESLAHNNDIFFINHDKNLLYEEKKWIQSVKKEMENFKDNEPVRFF